MEIENGKSSSKHAVVIVWPRVLLTLIAISCFVILVVWIIGADTGTDSSDSSGTTTGSDAPRLDVLARDLHEEVPSVTSVTANTPAAEGLQIGHREASANPRSSSQKCGNRFCTSTMPKLRSAAYRR